RIAPIGTAGRDQRGLGDVGEQAARARVPADGRGAAAARGGAIEMGEADGSDRRCHDEAGGDRVMKRPRFLFWRSAGREKELDDELQAHLRMAIADRMAQGESPEEAAANAAR